MVMSLSALVAFEAFKAEETAWHARPGEETSSNSLAFLH